MSKRPRFSLEDHEDYAFCERELALLRRTIAPPLCRLRLRREEWLRTQWQDQDWRGASSLAREMGDGYLAGGPDACIQHKAGRWLSHQV